MSCNSGFGGSWWWIIILVIIILIACGGWGLGGCNDGCNNCC